MENRFELTSVCRLLLDAVPLACDAERLDAQATPWETVFVRVDLLRPWKLFDQSA